MKRRTFCKALGLGAVWAACGAALPAGAEQSASAGRAVEGESVTLFYRSDLSADDVSHDYFYSDRFFDHSALEYDHDLALASLGLALSAFNTIASVSRYWIDGDAGRQDSLAAAFEELGFTDAEFHNYDVSGNTVDDFVAFGLARKTLIRDGQPTTLVALALRGGGYGNEWVCNMRVGSESAHSGLVAPVAEVFTTLQMYLLRLFRLNSGTFKLWLCGYSRGACVANLLAGRIHNELSMLVQDNTFVYTFAAPSALTAGDRPELQQDFAANDGGDWPSTNIFNLISSGDIVPRVMPGQWGYARNGSDRFLPSTKKAEELAALNGLAAGLGTRALDFTQLATAEETTAIVNSLCTFFGDASNYHQNYEAALMDMMECAFYMSEEETVEGKILTDEEIVTRLRGLTNMDQVPYWTIVRSVWAASTMSRPILERFGGNVPLRVQQIVIPMLAVGLCYGIDTDVLKTIVTTVLYLIARLTDPTDALRAGFCHYCENYIALMEYYSPTEHTLSPSTRQEDEKPHKGLLGH